MRKKSDKLIVLDIDETLFHTETFDMEDPDDYTFILRDRSNSTQFYTRKRPHLDEFIRYIKYNFEYGIYTSSTQDYATKQCEILGLDNPKFILHRDDCTLRTVKNEWNRSSFMSETYYLKRLKKLKKYSSINKMIAIDDKSECFNENFGNLIKVNPFLGDKKDDTLLKLIGFLKDLKNVEDITKVEKRGWMSKY